MADPEGYEPQYDFSNYQATKPSRPLPGHELDVELLNISEAINQTNEALGDVRRSDGRLQNGIVDADAIGPTAVGALIGQSTALMEDVVFITQMYLGQLAEAPTTGRDGGPLEPSHWYYDTVLEGYQYYDGTQFRPMTALAPGLAFTFGPFTGDGTTKTFTLPVTTTGVSQVYLAVGGVLQSHDRYTVSGTTLTLVDAPPLGQAVFGRVLTNSDVASAAGDAILLQGGESVQAYANRNGAFAARAAWIAALDWPWAVGAETSFNGLRVQYDGVATAFADAPGWKPAGDVTPNHFATNTTPGTTDMTAAVQAAATYSRAVTFLGEEYLITGPVTTVNSSRVYRGQSHQGTIITLGHTSGHGFIFDSSGTTVTDILVENMTVRGISGATRTAGGLFRFAKPTARFAFSGVRMQNYFDAISFSECSTSYVTGCWFSQFGIAAGGKGNHTINCDRTTSGQAAGAVDLHITDCQFSGLNSVDNASGLVSHIRANSCDGIYLNNSHFFYSDYSVYTDPNGTAYQNKIASIKASNCYFDSTYQHHVYMTGTTYEATNYREFDFDSCTFRDAKAVSVKINANVGRLSITDFVARGNLYGFLDAAISTCYDFVISDGKLVDNNVSDTAGVSEIDFGGSGCIIEAMVFNCLRSSGRAVRIRSTAQDYDVGQINVEKHANTTDPVLLESVDGYVDGVRKVTNANGTYFKFKDGRLFCQATVNVNVATSALQNFTLPLGLASGSRADATANYSHLTSSINAALYNSNIQRFGATETAWFILLAVAGTSSAPGTTAEQLSFSLWGRWK